MKKLKHFILLLILPITVFAQNTFMYNSLQFETLDKETCKVTAIVTEDYNHEYKDLLIGELNLPEHPVDNEIVYTLTEIDKTAFIACDKITSVIIPNSVTKIGNHAFEYCTGITSLTIGDSVTEIGNSAFSDCTSLTSLNIPNSVTVIDNYAFDGCSKLTNIVIGNSVNTIGDKSFNGCSSIKNIYYLPSVGIISNENIFDEIVYINAYLYSNYDINTSPWNRFKRATSGLESIKDDSITEIYTLSGLKVNQLSTGVYIIKQNSKVTKICNIK